jgi:hypothetical protein
MKGQTMDALEQMEIISRMISESYALGKTLTIQQAQRKIHREYITSQLWNKHGLNPSGFLVMSGFTDGTDGDFIVADPKYENIFNNFLNMNSKLSGPQSKQLREAMDKLGIDYLHSPTFPLDDVKTSTDVA